MLSFFAVSSFAIPRETYKMNSLGVNKYTLLDGDRIFVDSEPENVIYLSVQPHTLMGELEANITWNNGENFVYPVNSSDLLQIDCKSLILTYKSRGGVSLSIWQIPKSICQNKIIYSANQRSVEIAISDNFEENEKICWLLSFVKPVEIKSNVEKFSENGKIEIFDEKRLSNNSPLVIETPSNDAMNDTKNPVVVFSSGKGGFVNFTINAKADVSYADWTDSHRFFKKFDNGQLVEIAGDDTKAFISANRKVEPWIWSIFFVIGGSIFFSTVIFFFIRPVNKMRRSLSIKDFHLIKND